MYGTAECMATYAQSYTPRIGRYCTASEGHFIAFGNTEEDLRAMVFGVTEGLGPSGTRDRTTGAGRVNGRRGHYADAISKGHGVALLHTETTGAVAMPFVLLLRILASIVRRPGASDATVYGSSRSSTRSFLVHHLAAVSSSILFHNSVIVQAAAKALSHHVTLGAPLLNIDWRRCTSPRVAG